MPKVPTVNSRVTLAGEAAQMGFAEGRQLGLHLGDDWAMQNARETAGIFRNKALMAMGSVMSTAHPFAADYIKQAPVLVLAVMGGETINTAKKRHFVLTQWKAAAQNKYKLRDLMRLFQLPLPMRAIQPTALSAIDWPVIRALAKTDNSTLAQIIPNKGQRPWMRALSAWMWRCQNLAGRDSTLPHLAWCAAHWRDDPKIRSGKPGVAADLADFALAAGPRFNSSWTWQQAVAGQERWHRDLAKMQYGDDMVDYTPFPDAQEHAGYNFVALRSGIDLHAEGMAMHHCVASYFPQVVAGGSRIISIRAIGGSRVATVEYRPFRAAESQEGILSQTFGIKIDPPIRWELSQIRAHCNKDPGAPVWNAARSYRDWINGAAQ